MPSVRAPSGGNFFTDISKIGSDLIAGALEREKEREKKAREAALAADREQRTNILRLSQQAQQARFEGLTAGAEADRLGEEGERELERTRLGAGRTAAVQSLMSQFGLSEEEAINRVTAQEGGFSLPAPRQDDPFTPVQSLALSRRGASGDIMRMVDAGGGPFLANADNLAAMVTQRYPDLAGEAQFLARNTLEELKQQKKQGQQGDIFVTDPRMQELVVLAQSGDEATFDRRLAENPDLRQPFIDAHQDLALEKGLIEEDAEVKREETLKDKIQDLELQINSLQRVAIRQRIAGAGDPEAAASTELTITELQAELELLKLQLPTKAPRAKTKPFGR